MSVSFLPQIKNIVFLMLENRSLDNLLGWLYTPNDKWRVSSRPKHVYPEKSSLDYDGLIAGKFSNPDANGNSIPVTAISDDVWNSGYAVPYRDPYEALRAGNWIDPRDPGDNWNGVMNQFFGNQNIITGLPSGGTPAMQGFLQDYDSLSDGDWHGHDIVWTYAPTQATAINMLAWQYAVSDRWFCSVPTETNPNRAYSICGTSLGRESNLHWDSVEQYDCPTLFNRLGEKGITWGIFYSDTWQSGMSYTEYTFKQISDAKNGESGSTGKFYARANAGTLPAFTYLEPSWTTTTADGSDYHPNSHIFPGEKFLRRVYEAVRSGPQWPHTLLVVTFDEHGGTYDHVAPPWGAINPDGRNSENGFKFDMFGARVPTIFISPFVRNSTVFRAPLNSPYPFDHTSFIATFLLWAGYSREDLPKLNLGKRMPKAPTFEGVFDDQAVNSGELEFPADSLSAPLTPGRPAHPAGSAASLNAILAGIPIVPARTILRTSKTPEEVQNQANLYRQDPNKFEQELESSGRPRKH